ncbi:hypothetical protein CDD83_10873 [Cordyceps sp. RAO-2017]|nr:hypothetical protein CDD83_10873 [Cordyceps sp. RAO-2017]
MLLSTAWFEYLDALILPLGRSNARPGNGGTPLSTVLFLCDVSGFTLKNFWAMKGHIRTLADAVTARYPETVGHVFLVGAPSYFNTIWNWTKRFLDPVTASKFFILQPDQVKPTLETFIERRNIPVGLGGELEFEYGDPPALEPAISASLEWRDGLDALPSGPLLLEETDDGAGLTCFTCGTAKGNPRRHEVFTMPKPSPFGAAAGEDKSRPAAGEAVNATVPIKLLPIPDRDTDALPAVATPLAVNPRTPRDVPDSLTAARVTKAVRDATGMAGGGDNATTNGVGSKPMADCTVVCSAAA